MGGLLRLRRQLLLLAIPLLLGSVGLILTVIGGFQKNPALKTRMLSPAI